jgi:hypothetical protein
MPAAAVRHAVPDVARALRALALALLLPLAIEGSKWIRRRGRAKAPAPDAPHAVAPARAQASA